MSRLLRRAGSTAQRSNVPPQLLEALRDGPAPLHERDFTEAERLRIGFAVTDFAPGSEAHAIVADLVRGLEAEGHSAEVIISDPRNRHKDAAAEFRECFGPVAARVSSTGPQPSDVLVATSWTTVPEVLTTTGLNGRAYLVHDHEPDHYGASAQRHWAQWSYSQGLHCICSSPWVEQVVRDYGAVTSPFRPGIDHATYTSLPTHRRDDLLLAVNTFSGRRATPMMVLALTELHRRRPRLEIAIAGGRRKLETPFPYRDLGQLDGPDMAHAYASATVGLSLSLTNPPRSLIKMLSCGLPVVEARSESMLACFGANGPIKLAELDPLAICDKIELLFDDLSARADASRKGIELTADFTRGRAVAEFETGLRAALQHSGRQ